MNLQVGETIKLWEEPFHVVEVIRTDTKEGAQLTIVAFDEARYARYSIDGPHPGSRQRMLIGFRAN